MQSKPPAHFVGENNPVSLLYDRDGNRKYLTASERSEFLRVAREMPSKVWTLCLVLAYTGARLSEVLALTPQRIDLGLRLVVFESLKKRRRGLFRAVPAAPELLAALEHIHGIRAAQGHPECEKQPLWGWCRTTAWSRVKECMAIAGVTGPPATPKGLRHAFAVGALQADVPINFVRRWLGHARLSTTEIYANAVGEEERAIAERFWKTF